MRLALRGRHLLAGHAQAVVDAQPVGDAGRGAFEQVRAMVAAVPLP